MCSSPTHDCGCEGTCFDRAPEDHVFCFFCKHDEIEIHDDGCKLCRNCGEWFTKSAEDAKP